MLGSCHGWFSSGSGVEMARVDKWEHQNLFTFDDAGSSRRSVIAVFEQVRNVCCLFVTIAESCADSAVRRTQTGCCVTEITRAYRNTCDG